VRCALRPFTLTPFQATLLSIGSHSKLILRKLPNPPLPLRMISKPRFGEEPWVYVMTLGSVLRISSVI
jgi:hypothetical protein